MTRERCPLLNDLWLQSVASITHRVNSGMALISYFLLHNKTNVSDEIPPQDSGSPKVREVDL